MSVLSDILEWSNNINIDWISDALRRIVLQRHIVDKDFNELIAICKRAHGLDNDSSTGFPISSEHIQGEENGGSTKLVSLKHISDVNALIPNEEINFVENGLTIVYGDNGSGKSGYTRILKRACRSRGSSDPILANALSGNAAGIPTGLIKYQANGINYNFVWKDSEPGAQNLSSISVFDSITAKIHTSEKTEIRFRPFGLDVIDKLAVVSDKLRKMLQLEINILEKDKLELPKLEYYSDGIKLLENVTALTDIEDVKIICEFRDFENEELVRLTEIINISKQSKNDVKINNIQVKINRLEKLIKELIKIEILFEQNTLDKFKTANEELVNLELLRKEGVESISEEAKLSGFGTNEWNSMWKAAKLYSTFIAYKGMNFPHIHTDSKCVLCQQELSEATKKLLQKYEDWVQGELDIEVENKRADLKLSLESYHLLGDKLENHEAAIDVSVIDNKVYLSIETYCKEYKKCKDLLLSNHTAIKQPVSAPISSLNIILNNLRDQINEIKNATDSIQLQKIQTQYNILNEKKYLSEYQDRIIKDIKKKAKYNAYKRCINDTDTKRISKLSGDLTKKYVIETLIKGFDEELKRFGFKTFELELKSAGNQKGVPYHKLGFKRATNAQLANIVSEGESRCIALAAFLAEIRSTTQKSTIIFDDPVSSLDHMWKNAISKRLVEEAKERQVVVFTHDLVFLHDLTSFADTENVENKFQMVTRFQGLAGKVHESLPFAGLNVKKRIGELNKRCQDVTVDFKMLSRPDYDIKAISIYADLRKTWEGAIEEILLNKAVLRFRPSIETQRLSKISDITENDLKIINDGMTKCSKWEGGHDHSSAVNDPVPEPDELRQDIAKIKEWVDSINKRRK